MVSKFCSLSCASFFLKEREKNSIDIHVLVGLIWEARNRRLDMWRWNKSASDIDNREMLYCFKKLWFREKQSRFIKLFRQNVKRSSFTWCMLSIFIFSKDFFLCCRTFSSLFPLINISSLSFAFYELFYYIYMPIKELFMFSHKHTTSASFSSNFLAEGDSCVKWRHWMRA